MRMLCLLVFVCLGCQPGSQAVRPAGEAVHVDGEWLGIQPEAPTPAEGMLPEGAERLPTLAPPAPLQPIYKAPPEYVDERELPPDATGAELGKQYPHIIIDGVRCDWDTERKRYVDATWGCRVVWLQAGVDRQLMSQCEYRAGTDGQLHDGDIQVVLKPLQIRDGGAWRDLRPGDAIHASAAKALGLPAEGYAGDLVPIGQSLLLVEWDGKVWRHVDRATAVRSCE